MPILALGLSHHTAPVDVRDQVAIPSGQFGVVLEEMCRLPRVEEAAVISTCNRTEAYLVAEDCEIVVSSVIDVLCERNGIDPDVFRQHLYVHRDIQAARHLFAVAAGLESMIVGEPQIAGQVKDAGALGIETGCSGRLLNRLFRSAVEASKRARTETEIAAGAVSVSDVQYLVSPRSKVVDLGHGRVRSGTKSRDPSPPRIARSSLWPPGCHPHRL